MLSANFPLPGIEHGKRILTAVVEQRAKASPAVPWLSMPIDNKDISRGFKDITFWDLNNAANHAAQWLKQNLPPGDPFQCFAYAGPKDLRYPILAIAAAKAQKVMILPSPLVTPAAQLQILNKKSCSLYLRPDETAESVAEILKGTSNISSICVPALKEFLNETEASPVNYAKSWADGKDDPWLVFHTSGTTGNPKPITYSHDMMAGADMAASLPDIENSHIHQYAQRRWYTPLPSLHFVGMLMTLSMTTFLDMVAVIGPSGVQPSPELIIEVLQSQRPQGVLLPPVLIDGMCLSSVGLQALNDMEFIHYAGAPLSAKSAELLTPHSQVVSCVGSTEAGGYFSTIHPDAWDYVDFQKHAGAALEKRLGDLHELVFIRDPDCRMQQIFSVYPDRDRFETNDLLLEHPTRKNLWKFIGRIDDYVCLSHGEGLHASLLEPEITAHPSVNNAIVGGNGRPSSVLLVEFVKGTEQGLPREQLLESLLPYVRRLNSKCYASVQISLDKIILAPKEKPFIMTSKGSVARLQTLQAYEDEISALYT